MSKTFRDWNIEQRLLLPPTVDEFVPLGHLAYFVRETVREELDLSEIIATYDDDRGYPPYDPTMMTALLLYGYTQGIYSSRKMARACEQRLDVLAVTGLQKPDFRTINSFRSRHLAALGRLFLQVLKLCEQTGVVKLGHVALDGSKIKANASKHHSISYEDMREREDELSRQVQGWFDKAAVEDAEEDALYGEDRRGDELPEWVQNKQKRAEKIRQAREALEQEQRLEKSSTKAVRRNLTDPDSAMMRMPAGDFQQAYNVQAAVDAGSQVIIAAHACNAGNDKQQLKPLVAMIKRNTGRQARQLSADADYCTLENLKELKRRHIHGYIPTGKFLVGKLLAPAQRREFSGPYFDEMKRRIRQGGRRSRFRLRKISVEPVYGQIKAARGFNRFLLRGLHKVHREWQLICTAHNLLKLSHLPQTT